MEYIISQLLSCLYLYDSGILVTLRFRKQSRYTGMRHHGEVCAKLVYRREMPQGSLRKAGIPACDTTGKFAQSRYTGFCRPKDEQRLRNPLSSSQD